jgi:hypothetical protein
VTTETTKNVTNEPAGLAAWAAKWLGVVVAFTHDDGRWYFVHTDGEITVTKTDEQPAYTVPYDRVTAQLDGAVRLYHAIENKLHVLGFDVVESKHLDGCVQPCSVRIGKVSAAGGYPLYGGLGRSEVIALLKAARYALDGPPTFPVVAVRWTDDANAASAKTAAALEMQRVVRELFALTPTPYDVETEGHWNDWVNQRVSKLVPVTSEKTTDDGDPPKVPGYDRAIVELGKVLGRTVWIYSIEEALRIAARDVVHPDLAVVLEKAQQVVNFEFGKDRGSRSPVLLCRSTFTVTHDGPQT